MNSINKTARIAGILYFMYIVTSIIGNEFGRFVSVDAPVTVNHIMTHAIAISYRFCNQSILSCVFSFGGLVFVRVIKTGEQKHGFTVPVIKPGWVCYMVF